jgi:hypothetical protein
MNKLTNDVGNRLSALSASDIRDLRHEIKTSSLREIEVLDDVVARLTPLPEIDAIDDDVANVRSFIRVLYYVFNINLLGINRPDIVALVSEINRFIKDSSEILASYKHESSDDVYIITSEQAPRMKLLLAVTTEMTSQEELWKTFQAVKNKKETSKEKKEEKETKKEMKAWQADVHKDTEKLHQHFDFYDDTNEWQPKKRKTTRISRTGFRQRITTFNDSLPGVAASDLLYFDSNDYKRVIEYLRVTVLQSDEPLIRKLRKQFKLMRNQLAVIAEDNHLDINDIVFTNTPGENLAVAIDLSKELKRNIDAIKQTDKKATSTKLLEHAVEAIEEAEGKTSKKKKKPFNGKDEMSDDEDTDDDDEDEEEETEEEEEEEDVDKALKDIRKNDRRLPEFLDSDDEREYFTKFKADNAHEIDRQFNDFVGDVFETYDASHTHFMNGIIDWQRFASDVAKKIKTSMRDEFRFYDRDVHDFLVNQIAAHLFRFEPSVIDSGASDDATLIQRTYLGKKWLYDNVEAELPARWLHGYKPKPPADRDDIDQELNALQIQEENADDGDDDVQVDGTEVSDEVAKQVMKIRKQKQRRQIKAPKHRRKGVKDENSDEEHEEETARAKARRRRLQPHKKKKKSRSPPSMAGGANVKRRSRSRSPRT